MRALTDRKECTDAVQAAPVGWVEWGESRAMGDVVTAIDRVAATPRTTVLVMGESGTGKEIVAREIHRRSARKDKPFVAVNCAGFADGLLEADLFGYASGAFTGALPGGREGLFAAAHGGSILLDEIGELDMNLQAHLLRVLQERTFRPVGSAVDHAIDVRILAATNRDLGEMVSAGRFREDLYYRLNVVKIDLPPLRDRPEDIPLLATHFADKYARSGEMGKRISAAAMDVLLAYHWPGNIRELENAIERASVTSPDKIVGPDNLPQELTSPPAGNTPFNIDVNRALPEVLNDAVASIEQQYLRKALKLSHGNVGRCAKISGLSRRSVTAKIAAYQIDKALFKYDGWGEADERGDNLETARKVGKKNLARDPEDVDLDESA